VLLAVALVAGVARGVLDPPSRRWSARVARIPRGGAGEKKVKKLDPRGTPLVARAARPLTSLLARYEAAVEENPKLELWIQFGGVLALSQAIKLLVKRYGEKRQAVLVARALYVGFLLAHQALLSAVKARVEAENDTTPLTLPGSPLLASIAAQGAQQGETSALLRSLLARETTVRDYDLEAVRKGRHSQIGSMLLELFFHFRHGYLHPLILHTVVGFVSLAKDPLVQIHLLGRPAEGKLSRPFVPQLPAWLRAWTEQKQHAAAPPPNDQVEAASALQDDDDDDDDDLPTADDKSPAAADKTSPDSLR